VLSPAAPRAGVEQATDPAQPDRPAHRPSACQGALTIAATSSVTQKWTTVGVPNAPISSGGVELVRVCPTTLITTNCRPVSAAAEDRR